MPDHYTRPLAFECFYKNIFYIIEKSSDDNTLAYINQILVILH